MTGGYLYHQRIADPAPAHHARVDVLSLCLTLPATGAGGARGAAGRRPTSPDVLLLDSIAAAFLSLWVGRRPLPPLVAIPHQPPGGIDHAAVRRRVESALHRHAYRHAVNTLNSSTPSLA